MGRQEERAIDSSHDGVGAIATSAAAAMPPTGSTLTPPEWVGDIEAEVQPMPSPSPRPPPLQLEYDSRGRVTKRSFLQNYSGPTPGAYAESPSGECSLRSSMHSTTSNRAYTAPLEDSESHSVPEGDVESQDSTGDFPIIKIRTQEEEEEPKWWLNKHRVAAAMLVLLLVGLAIVMPILFTICNTAEDVPMAVEGSIQEEREPLVTQTMASYFTRIPNITTATVLALQDPHSPQSRAYEWVSKDPHWDGLEDWRKQQRFALACFYYAQVFSHLHYKFRLDYETNECHWIIGTDLCGDGRVRYLRIVDTSFTLKGDISHEMLFLSQLEMIDLTVDFSAKHGGFDHLEAFLPLYNFANLTELKLSNCELEGTIPSTLGFLTSLTSLDLSGNQLSGSIPEEIGDLPAMKVFNVRDNPLLEPSTPAGLCTEDRVLQEWKTDWCADPMQCCSGQRY